MNTGTRRDRASEVFLKGRLTRRSSRQRINRRRVVTAGLYRARPTFLTRDPARGCAISRNLQRDAAGARAKFMFVGRVTGFPRKENELDEKRERRGLVEIRVRVATLLE